jgi:hypothetical protein
MPANSLRIEPSINMLKKFGKSNRQNEHTATIEQLGQAT